jgi:hypothetical protein
MQHVTRFTTEFVPLEDRMRLALEGNEGRVRLVWLTRRLLFQMLPKLLEVFGPPETTPSATVRHQARQGFNQQAAVSSIERQKPVRVASPDVQQDPDILVWSIDIQKQSPRQVTLVFKSQDEAESQAIPFNPPALRQWLSVLHQQFQLTGWRADFWPKWISVPDNSPSISKMN